ncbi:SPFH domain-containing protein [Streptomyces sp. NBC_00250]|uniref:SPFH domain-containing protein n=1 Tax=Streptomyces sp. NBC_00250 TaxID=2903641 RepID=UPI002E2B00A9|nr:SPFH domain-containing protein [Streptomyces sp. NBC_00250]
MTERQKRPLPVRARRHTDGIPMDDLFRSDRAQQPTTTPSKTTALPKTTTPSKTTAPAQATALPGTTEPTVGRGEATAGAGPNSPRQHARQRGTTPTEPTTTRAASPRALSTTPTARSASGTPAPALPRCPPPVDPDLVERPGPAVPGWTAVLTGLTALVGIATALWRARPLREVELPPWEWAALAGCVVVAVVSFGGLTRGRTGSAWVLSLFGRYRGSVRRTGLVWISPFVLRRRIDVRLRHWRSEPIAVVDAEGSALRVVVLVVWSVRDTARALLSVDDHLGYLREQVEAAAARVLSQLPADAFRGGTPTLRDAEAVGDALTRMLAAECRPVGIAVFSAQPTRIEYAPEVASAMRRRQIAVLDAKHRDSVLTGVIDAVDDTVTRLTVRGLVELDDFERQALVKDLTVAFYTRSGGPAHPNQE